MTTSRQAVKRCPHLITGDLAKHSDLALTCVPPEQNPTVYQYDERIELCVYCSGLARGALNDIIRTAL